jgi:hypothetical protein
MVYIILNEYYCIIPDFLETQNNPVDDVLRHGSIRERHHYQHV